MEVVLSITDKGAPKFIRRNMITRFGITRAMVFDNVH